MESSIASVVTPRWRATSGRVVVTAVRATWTRLGFTNPPADRLINGFRVTTDDKGPGKHRAVYRTVLTA